jgi:hypothetical protein
MRNELKQSVEAIQRELQKISKINVKYSELVEIQNGYGFSDGLMTEIFCPKKKTAGQAAKALDPAVMSERITPKQVDSITYAL